MSRHARPLTEGEAQRLQAWARGERSTSQAPKGNKFRNVPTDYAGLHFDSKREAQRAQELLLMEKAGLISDLVLDKRQLCYDLIVNGVKIGRYTPDSQYIEQGVLIVEDVKSKPTRTREYRRTKKLMAALYAIEIREVD